MNLRSVLFTAGLEEIISNLNANPSLGQIGGFVTVENKDSKVIGVITDADIRRARKKDNLDNLNALDICRKDFIRIYDFQNPLEASNYFKDQLNVRNVKNNFPISYIPILNKDDKLVQIMHISQLMDVIGEYLQEVVIIGLGFVGLTLAAALAKLGLQVIGIENNEFKYNAILEKRPQVFEPQLVEILENTISKNFLIKKNIEEIVDVRIPNSRRIYIITVGTPVDGLGVNLNHLVSATDAILTDLKQGDLVITRSTVPVGSTRNIIGRKIQDQTGYLPGRDFHLISAPERTIEGRAIEEINNLPQLVGGFSDSCTATAVSFFSKVSPSIVSMESLEACEFAKLMSNAYRDVNFNFSNEMAYLASQHNIDINNVIRNSNVGYPRNQIAKPSPGVGGPCLVKDSWILLSNMRKLSSSLLMSARKFNSDFMNHLVSTLGDSITKEDKIIALGLAFKGNPVTNDFRDSSGLSICENLKSKSYEIYGYDSMLNSEIKSNIEISIVNSLTNLDFIPSVILILNNNEENRLNALKLFKKYPKDIRLIFDPWQMLESDLNQINNIVYVTLSKKMVL